MKITHSVPLAQDLPRDWRRFWIDVLSPAAQHVYTRLRRNAARHIDLQGFALRHGMTPAALGRVLTELRDHGFLQTDANRQEIIVNEVPPPPSDIKEQARMIGEGLRGVDANPDSAPAFLTWYRAMWSRYNHGEPYPATAPLKELGQAKRLLAIYGRNRLEGYVRHFFRFMQGSRSFGAFAARIETIVRDCAEMRAELA